MSGLVSLRKNRTVVEEHRYEKSHKSEFRALETGPASAYLGVGQTPPPLPACLPPMCPAVPTSKHCQGTAMWVAAASVSVGGERDCERVGEERISTRVGGKV